eukprot:UN02199
MCLTFVEGDFGENEFLAVQFNKGVIAAFDLSVDSLFGVDAYLGEELLDWEMEIDIINFMFACVYVYIYVF